MIISPGDREHGFDVGVAAKGEVSSASSLDGSKSYIYDPLSRASMVSTTPTSDIPYQLGYDYDVYRAVVQPA